MRNLGMGLGLGAGVLTDGGPAAPFASDKWRIFIPNTTGISFGFMIAELQFLDAGGNELSQGGVITFSSEHSTYDADLLFDDIAATHWESSGVVTDQWVQYTTPVAISPVEIMLQARSTWQGNMPITYKIQAWDYTRNRWIVFLAVEGSSPWNASEIRTLPLSPLFPPAFDPVDVYDAYGLFEIDNSNEYKALAEFELRAVSGGPSAVGDGTPTVSTEYNNSYAGHHLFDNNAGTKWASTSNSGPQFVQYAFNNITVPIVEIMLKSRTDGYVGQAPTSFEVRGRKQGFWNTLLAVENLPEWSVGEERTFVIQSGGTP